MLRTTIALILIAAAAGAAWLLAPRLAALAETRYSAQVDATLSAGGFGWARGEVDGLVATISGPAPSAAAEAEAIALVTAISPVLTVKNAITEAPRVAPNIIPPELEILKGADGLILIGVVADPAMMAALDGDAALLSFGAAPFTADWQATAPLLSDIATSLRHARLTIADDAITIDGLANAGPDQIDFGPLLDKLTALGWRVTARIDTPPPVLEDFRLTVAKTADGAKISCAAADPTNGALIEAAAKTHLQTPARCAIGAGAPDDDWVDASIAVLAAMQPLAAAEASLAGKIVNLTLAPPTTQAAATEATEALAATLPPGYRLIISGEPLTPEVDQPRPFSLTINWPGGAGPIAISSTQSDDGLTRVEASLGAYARALFPGAHAKFSTGVGAPPPENWRRAARIALEALSNLARGTVQVDDDSITLNGVAEKVDDIRAAHDALAVAGGDWRIETRIAYDPAILAAAQPLPPRRCAAAVGKTAAETPISFQPASATLTPTGQATTGKIAAILTRCEGAMFEIGGHTDAQGSEGGNLSLSRARAEAVLSALIAAKAPPGRLIAKGYGEAQPIADNATAVGRALNRRIEFTLIEDKE